MINKNLSDILLQDLQSLVDNKVPESRTLEYKKEITLNTGDEKKEFLADVSSFANASGGDLIIGIPEEKTTKLPLQIDGISVPSFDNYVLSISNIIRDGISPRISGIQIQLIDVIENQKCVIIRIPKSFNSPHQVSYNGHDKFYTRNSAGKHKLDVEELRIAFNLSDSYVERIKKFKQERLGKIFEGRSPIALPSSGKMVLHFIPLMSLQPNKRYEIPAICNDHRVFRSLGFENWGTIKKYVFEGKMAYYTDHSGVVQNYTLLFQNGIIEQVNTSDLRTNSNMEKIIPSLQYEKTIIDGFQNAMKIYMSMNMDLPILSFLSLINLEGYKFGIDKFAFHRNELPSISEQNLILPEILIENYNVNVEEVVKDWFDSIWNAAGFERSLNYDDNGKWRANR